MAASARARTYWICQLLGWGIYLGINAVAFGLAKLSGAFALSLACLCGTGLALTHVLRTKRGRTWSALPIGQLLPKMVGSSVAMSVVINALGLSLMWLLALERRPFSLSSLFVFVFNWSVVFFVWQLLYFGVHLVERSRRAELASYQMQAAAHAAQLQALKAQLNPHFLFNCLNSLRALIAEDPTRAQQVVTQLAVLLRYSLQAAATETVPLERELNVVRDYLSLEGVRLEERLRVHFEVAPECLPVLVPALLVQSLVENGIKHGIAQRPDGGEIGVRAFRDGASLRLEVSNPPAPALLAASASASTSTSAPASTSALASTRTDEPKEGGVGLANATERLRLLFGEAAALSLNRTREDKVVAEVRLPWTE
jgi:LytS/YehU family sensor histidine kinase